MCLVTRKKVYCSIDELHADLDCDRTVTRLGEFGLCRCRIRICVVNSDALSAHRPNSLSCGGVESIPCHNGGSLVTGSTSAAQYSCACEFAQAPTNNACLGMLVWHIREGNFGDVGLDGFDLWRSRDSRATFGRVKAGWDYSLMGKRMSSNGRRCYPSLPTRLVAGLLVLQPVLANFVA